jgi:hypothetical protein
MHSPIATSVKRTFVRWEKPALPKQRRTLPVTDAFLVPTTTAQSAMRLCTASKLKNSFFARNAGTHCTMSASSNVKSIQSLLAGVVLSDCWLVRRVDICSCQLNLRMVPSEVGHARTYRRFLFGHQDSGRLYQPRHRCRCQSCTGHQ